MEDEKLKKLIAANFGRLKNDPIKQSKLLKEYMRLCGVGGAGRPQKTTDYRSIIKREDIVKELGRKTIPVIINKYLEDEDEKLKKLIAANFGRLKNDPIKQAKLLIEYEKLSGVRQGSAGKRKIDKDNLGLNQEEFAKEFGISTQQLRDIKRLTTLIPEFQDIISSGCITSTTGFKVLARLSDEEQQKLLSQLPASQKLTQKQIGFKSVASIIKKSVNAICVYI